MSNIMEYKGYHAKIEYSAEDKTFVGNILGINDVLAFDGETISQLEDMFHDNIDDYLVMCEEIGKEPDKEYKGSFNVRVTSELHKKAAMEAEGRGISLNQFVSDAVSNELDGNHLTEKIVILMPHKTIENYIMSNFDKTFPQNLSEKKEEFTTCKTLSANLRVTV